MLRASNLLWFWQSKPNADRVNIDIEPFDPNSVAHLNFINDKVTHFKNNYDTFMSDIKNVIWPLVVLLLIYKSFSKLLSIPLLVVGVLLDYMYYHPEQLAYDALQRCPDHINSLKELEKICAWMARDPEDASITHNKAFLNLVKTIHTLIPVERIPFSDLSKVKDLNKISKEYLQILQLPSRDLSQVLSIITSMIVGTTAEQYVNQVKDYATKAYNMIPAGPGKK